MNMVHAHAIDCEIPRVALVLTDSELEGETSVSEAAIVNYPGINLLKYMHLELVTV